MPKKPRKVAAKPQTTNTARNSAERKAQAIAEFTQQMREIAQLMGKDAFLELGIQFGLEHEARLRANDPNSPMLELIDEWRAQQPKAE